MAGTVLPVEQVYGGNPYRDDYQPSKTEIIQYLKSLEAGIAGIDLPGLTTKSYIVAFNVRGTANAIVADTAIPVPAIDGGALIALPIVADNTASPVTVSFNGGGALTIKANSGNDVSGGGLTVGMIAAGYVSGSTFRLLSDQAGAAIVAAAEAAADRAEAAAAGLNIPTVQTGDAGKVLTAKADETGYDLIDTGAVTLEMFGAVGDWDHSAQTGTDDTAALQAAVDSGRSIQLLPKKYRITQQIVTTLPVVLRGSDKISTQLVFDDCDGFAIDHSALSYSIIDFQGVAFVTNAQKTRTAVNFTGAANTGDQAIRRVQDCVFIGSDRIAKLGGTYLDAWLYGFDVEQGDRLTIEDTWFQGAEQDRVIGTRFPAQNMAIRANNTSHLKLRNSPITIWETGIQLTGLSEGMRVQSTNIVACNRGINFFSSSSPANDHRIWACHVSCYMFNINLSVGSVGVNSIQNTITNCNLFRRSDDPEPNFTYVKIAAQGTIITGNWFHSDDGTESVSNSETTISFESGDAGRNIVANNYFYLQNVLVRYAVGSDRNLFCNNLTRDNSATLGVAPIVDSGTSNAQWCNGGDRHAFFPAYQAPANDDTVLAARSWTIQTGADRKTGAKITSTGTNAVNYPELLNGAAGAPARFRASGGDATIDLTLEPKGAAGRVQFGFHTALGSEMVTGYIEVKDASGTVRKLAVVS